MGAPEVRASGSGEGMTDEELVGLLRPDNVADIITYRLARYDAEDFRRRRRIEKYGLSSSWNL
jgi:hypothetical protein